MLSWLLGRRTLEQQIQAGEFDAALKTVDDALLLQPADPELLELRARVLARQGRSDEAVEVYVQLANSFAERGFGMRAIALLKQAQQLSPASTALEALIGDTASLAHLDDVAESPLFCMFSRDELVSMVKQLEVMTFEPGGILLMQGKPGDSLFVIASGEVCVFAEDDQGRPRQVSKIPAPAFFGEIAVIRGGLRTATVTAASPVAVLELTRAGLDRLAASQPNIEDVLAEFAQQREAELHSQGLLKDGRA